MSYVTCYMNSVNGNNTGSVTRTGPGKSYPSAGTLLKKNCPNGFVIDTSVGGTNNYYKLVDPDSYPGITSNGGTVYVWISSTYLTSPDPASLQTAASAEASETSNSPAPAENAETTSSSDGLDQAIYNMLNSIKIEDTLESHSRVFGMPFQFTDVADYRPTTSQNYGRKYIENIIAEAPIVYFTPGLPNYMPDVDEEVKEAMDNYIKNKAAGNKVSNEAVAEILNTEARYYDFIAAYADYSRYVNMLCRVCAIYMGLNDHSKYTVPGTAGAYYETYDWGKWATASYNPKSDSDKGDGLTGIFDGLSDISDKVKDDIFGDYKYLRMYVDPSMSFNESNSNNSTQSQVAGLFDTLEGIVKEIGFFSNGSGILDGAVTNVQNIGTSTIDAANGVLDPNVSAGLSKVLGSASHVITGSNVIFPELWSDSAYNKSYSFTINLVSPYGDIESIYLNIIVPMMHLLALSMPRQTSANSFGSPFLVKVFAKGWFSCELGMVDSISIEKVAQSYNVHGLPNEVKITISVKDLYTNLMIAKSSTPKLFFSNQGLIEFLAVTCGLNLTEGNLGTKIDTIIKTLLNSLSDIPSNMYDNIIQEIRNLIEPIYMIR